VADEQEKIRLQLYLAKSGVGSRRKCGELVDQGLVKVNGVVVKEPYFKVDPEKDAVEFAGRVVKPSKYQFVKLNKPSGYVSTMRDDRGRKAVIDLIPQKYGRLFPVGRLDLDSEGLVILTNHGEAANRMMHPRYHFPKVYHVTLDHPPHPAHLKEMCHGVEIPGAKTLPAVYELMGESSSKRVKVELTEGRKRQIKMVFRQFGYRVVKLRRMSIGPIKLGNLKSGETSEFTIQEIMQLLEALDLE
jgi:23S rRNA pseudouridine2605 synthase